MQDSGESWYYEHSGARTGPVERDKLRDLIRSGSVGPSTLVWGGSGDWVEVEKTALAEDLTAARGGAPPPLPAAAVDNRLAWAIAIAPVIGAGIEAGLPGWDLWWIYFGLYIGLCFWDVQRLNAAGYKAPRSAWAFLVPGYLWQRATLLKQPKVHVAVWVVCFVATLFLPMA